MINIAQRPQEADDRAVPGHWEGDLLIGKNNRTAIGTLVERSTGYAMLVHLPDGYKPDQVTPALAAKIKTLPDTLRRSLTWDQGPEMRDWKQVRIDAGSEIYLVVLRSAHRRQQKPGPGVHQNPRISDWQTPTTSPTSRPPETTPTIDRERQLTATISGSLGMDVVSVIRSRARVVRVAGEG